MNRETAKWRVIVVPYKDTGRWRWLRERRWFYTRESLYGTVGSLDKSGYASSLKRARKKALRGLTFEWAGSRTDRAEMVYALHVPELGRMGSGYLKPGPLKPQMLEEDSR